ncbi:hypothetical protein RRG08_066281 [Elysia crispata]|uniref:Uncharacterized protein n=1 Tax=Elysia crispata TaxID=231223 RepID=A0AAE0Y7E1_9GAST|nr:hypothetical protein RRG08_066281 [Elysia crispata]
MCILLPLCEARVRPSTHSDGCSEEQETLESWIARLSFRMTPRGYRACHGIRPNLLPLGEAKPSGLSPGSESSRPLLPTPHNPTLLR